MLQRVLATMINFQDDNVHRKTIWQDCFVMHESGLRQVFGTEEWSRQAHQAGKGVGIGFLHEATWRQNVRLEVRAIFMLSVEAIGRRVLKSSARLTAGIGDGDGDVEVGVGADATEPSDARRGMSAALVRTQEQ